MMVQSLSHILLSYILYRWDRRRNFPRHFFYSCNLQLCTHLRIQYTIHTYLRLVPSVGFAFAYNMHIIHFMALNIGIESHQTTNKMEFISHTNRNMHEETVAKKIHVFFFFLHLCQKIIIIFAHNTRTTENKRNA